MTHFISFVKIFNYLIDPKLKSISKIVKKYNNSSWDFGTILNIYLTINGFRKACLDSGKFLMMNDSKLNKFEKLFKVKMYKIEDKKKNIRTYLITTDKTIKMKKIAEHYEKYTYTNNISSSKARVGQTNMGKALEYIHPANLKKSKRLNDGIIFSIFYENKPISSDIYWQRIDYDNLSQKDLLKIYKKLFIMRKLLKKISDKFSVEMRIDLN